MVELCCCGHTNDHIARKCGHENCVCVFGQRVDLATFRLAAETNQMMAEMTRCTTRILGILEAATGLQSRIVADGEGSFRVDVRQRPTGPTLIVPR